ncbi:tyrosine-type recombinase/integrase [Methanococcus maripaludis]|uniref:Integrase n=1 Tax=Methanococcus maripaludis TaxID=39152 RepID=A0A7J9PNP7_METMI|nr:tyrosine-type recombinase/integrase [Methanococcus maripaludis]MBA2864394.1 integrase [Methanococcus maripaludis]
MKLQPGSHGFLENMAAIAANNNMSATLPQFRKGRQSYALPPALTGKASPNLYIYTHGKSEMARNRTRSLKQQFKFAIVDSSFKEHLDKHSLKKDAENDNSWRVYSYSEKNNLMDLSANFCKFLNENHVEIMQLKDITEVHVQEFLNFKADTCTAETLYNYRARFRKIANCVNHAFNSCSLNFSNIVIPQSLVGKSKRNLMMTEEHAELLLNYCKHSNSRAAIGVKFALMFGLRVSEITKIMGKDIDLKNLKLHIHKSKGGRSRDISIAKELVPYLKEIKKEFNENQRICPLKNDSVNRFVFRTFKFHGINDYKDAKTSIHAIRKLWAQKLYDKLRNEGKTIKEACEEVSVQLGHGKDRKDVFNRYISKIW